VNLKLGRGRPYAARVILLSVSLSALVAGSPALAQPVTNWTGFYAGFYAGSAFGRSKSQTSSDCPAASGGGGLVGGYYCDLSVQGSLGNANAVTRAGTGSASSTGFTGGIEFGQNWQLGSFVYGIEGDFGAFRIRTSRSVTATFPGNSLVGPVIGNSFTVTDQTGTDWLLTARGRVGWTVSNWLLFATGGLAMSRVSVTNSYSDNASIGQDVAAVYSKIKLGWTVGGGVEVAVTKNWSLKGEYLYVDLGSVDTQSVIGVVAGGGPYANAIGVSTSLTAHVARLAANYKF
jgi:outer membrane immunogenic protein